MTAYTFEPYDVVQICRDGKWLDFCTLRSDHDGRRAIRMVDTSSWDGEHHLFRIIRNRPGQAFVQYERADMPTDLRTLDDEDQRIAAPHHMGTPGLSIAEEALTVAQASIVTGKVVPGTEKKVPKPKKESRTAKWSRLVSDAASALAQLRELQEEFENWRDNLPENLQSSALGEKLDTVCELDIEGAISTIDDASSAELPLGFGRD